jgi:hypothetical protein
MKKEIDNITLKKPVHHASGAKLIRVDYYDIHEHNDPAGRKKSVSRDT